MGKSVCFTGHRPEKIIKPYDENHEMIISIKQQLNNHIEKSIKDGYNTFYSGLARGCDIFASEIVLNKKKDYPFIKHVAVIPFRGQEKSWSDMWQQRYQSIIKQSDICIVLNEEYQKDCFKQRNEFIVENSNRIIAVYSKDNSGTRQTLNFAKKNNKEIIIISLI